MPDLAAPARPSDADLRRLVHFSAGDGRIWLAGKRLLAVSTGRVASGAVAPPRHDVRYRRALLHTPSGGVGTRRFVRHPAEPMTAGRVPDLVAKHGASVMDQQRFTVERRRNLALRCLSDDVYPRIEALVDTPRTWGGQELTLLACRAVRESHPQLSPSEAQILVEAQRRLHRSRRVASASVA